MPTQGERIAVLETQFDLTIKSMKKKIYDVHDTLYKNGALEQIKTLAKSQESCERKIAEIKKYVIRPTDGNGDPIDRREPEPKINTKKWTRAQKISLAVPVITLMILNIVVILEKFGQFIDWLVLVLRP